MQQSRALCEVAPIDQRTEAETRVVTGIVTELTFSTRTGTLPVTDTKTGKFELPPIWSARRAWLDT